jgi:signal transduction histidine kinase
MDYLQNFFAQFRNRLFGLFLINNLILAADWWLAEYVLKLTGYRLVLVLVAVPLLSLLLFSWLGTVYLTKPSKLLWQAILHILPDSQNIPAPKLENITFGREFVSHLANNVYQLAIDGARLAVHNEQAAHDLHNNEIATKLPLPLIVLDTNSVVTFANTLALRYFETAETDIIGKNFHLISTLKFSTEDTLDKWLDSVRDRAVSDSHTWQQVKTTLTSNKTLQFDMAASYSKDDPQNHEILLAIFDRTSSYEEDDQNLSFISLVVHELRTPISLLLGYIELFEEELNGKLNPELTRFMYQMKSAGQNLSSFVSNVLTIARLENNKLELQLTEEDWATIVKQAISDIQLRAQVQGVTIKTQIANKLPTVGVNPVTASEVITNLIDNAIKYSKDAQSKTIIVRVCLNTEGLVETTVQDFGVGIPASVIPNLFEKFYRNHRNRMYIGGTGLGLYLCKMIVEAHEGNIWVQSRDGQGATFGFTLKPYSALASGLKKSNNTDITHSAHGWIKNHSLYRS